MKKLKIIISLLLSLVMLLSLAACDFCTPDPSDSDSGTPAESESESESESEEIKTSPYVIVIPEKASATVSSAAVQLQSSIKALLGYMLEIKGDYMSWADTPNEYEILVGDVERDEAEAVEGLKLKDFSVTTSEKKWILKGGDDSATAAAVNYFCANCLDIFEACPADYSYYSEGSYTVKSFTLCGKDVSEYIMVYPNNAPACEKYATRVQTKIAALCGTIIPIYKDSVAPKNTPAISFGNTSSDLCDFASLGYDSHEIATAEGNVSFAGGCPNAYYTAIEKFEAKLTQTAELSLTEEELRSRFDQVARSEYINNADLFVPIWKRTYNTGVIPTFAEKVATISNPQTSTLMTMAHRGEHEYYPDNSVEALISAYHAGIYVVEMDLRYTADGVPIILHDATLNRMTNFDDLKGTTVNGIELPTSEYVSDWTYEQLMQLNLKTGLGGSGAVVTDYKIASLEDMLRASKDKIFIWIEDKLQTDHYFDDIYAAMQKTGNYTSYLIGRANMTPEQCVELQAKIKREAGKDAVIYARASTSNVAEAASYFEANATGPYAILLNGAYKVKNKTATKNAIEALDKCTVIGGWTIGGEDDAPATEEYWQEMYDLGYRIIMVNNNFELLKFAKNLNK